MINAKFFHSLLSLMLGSCEEHSLPTLNSLSQLISTLDGVVSVVEFVINVSLTVAIPLWMGSLVVAMCSPGLLDVPLSSVVVKHSPESFAFVSLSAASPCPSFIVTPPFELEKLLSTGGDKLETSAWGKAPT